MKLEEKEFEQLKDFNTVISRLKTSIADAEIRKHSLLMETDHVRTLMLEQEKQLIEKYGIGSVINMQTGEVTQKTNEST